MKYFWSWPYWRINPSLHHPVFNLEASLLGAETGETGSKERVLGWLFPRFLQRKKMPVNFLVVSIKGVMDFFSWILLKRFARPVRTMQHSSDEIRPISRIMRKVISPQRGWWGFHQISQPFPVTYTAMHSSQPVLLPPLRPLFVKLPSGYYWWVNTKGPRKFICIWYLLFMFIFLTVLGIEPGTSCMLDECSATELFCHSWIYSHP